MLYSRPLFSSPFFSFYSTPSWLKLAAVRDSSNNKLLIVIVHYLQTLLTNSRIILAYYLKSFGKFDAKKDPGVISDYLRYFSIYAFDFTSIISYKV